MEFKTINQWDEEIWEKVKPIYEQAFAGKGAKPEKIIRNMFRKKICFLHWIEENEQILAMALTGTLQGLDASLIDYLAVSEDLRERGVGLKMVEFLKDWILSEKKWNGAVIEVEAEKTPENLARLQFWRKCGFQLTDYVHHYIWVPEPYLAMYWEPQEKPALPKKGEELFRFIGNFHKASFQR